MIRYFCDFCGKEIKINTEKYFDVTEKDASKGTIHTAIAQANPMLMCNNCHDVFYKRNQRNCSECECKDLNCIKRGLCETQKTYQCCFRRK